MYKVVAKWKGFNIAMLERKFKELDDAKSQAAIWKKIGYEVELSKIEMTTLEESLNGRSKSISNH